MPQPFLRLPRQGDGKNVRKLLHLAYDDIPDDKAARLATTVGNGVQGDGHRTKMIPRRGGASIELDVYFSMRIADSGTGRVAGCVYAGPPIGWITSRDMSLTHRKLLATRLVEIQLMAVGERFRHQGIGSLLLADCERRYREQGYTAALLITSASASPLLVPWYEERGYVFEDQDRDYTVRFFKNRALRSSYDHTLPGQRIAFKALDPSVSVGLQPATYNHAGYALPLTYEKPEAAGLLDQKSKPPAAPHTETAPARTEQ